LPEEIGDIEQLSRDIMLKKIAREFKGHKLALLVEAIIKAQGYVTNRSEPGPDGGVDILAGSGPLGFESPKICIQVKSSSSPVGVDILQKLQGAVNNFKAEQGLLVSWGGFKRTVLEEARRNFFTVRLWDSGTLLNEILKHYEKFSDELKAEFPLKRIWSPVLEG
jgi:restriction system protein